MVVGADAVVDPWAMMIISLDAPVANTAMPGPGGSHDLAFRTELQRIYHFHQCLKVANTIMRFNMKLLTRKLTSFGFWT